MEFDFSDIDALGAKPNRMEFDFSDITAMGKPQLPNTPTISGVPPVKPLPNHPNRPSPHPPVTPDVIRDFIPAVKYGENTLQLNKALGDLSQREYVEENPWEALLETAVKKIYGHDTTQPKTDEQIAALEEEVAERRRVQESQRIMGTKDYEGGQDIPAFLAGNIGASVPAMARSIASLGTMTPDIMSNEINANLAEMENLSSKDRRALSKGGGLIAATLENLGLKWLIKGIPPGVFAKMGLNKTAALIESNIAARVVAKGGTASLTEGITEGGQEAVGIGAELIAGKDFQEGEIADRIKEAVTIGATTGAAMSGGGTVTAEAGKLAAEVPKAAGKKVAEGVSKVKEKVVDKLKPEQTEITEPKFDKTTDRRKKLKVEEPKLDVKESDGIFIDDEGQKWQKLEVDENLELKEEIVKEPTEAEAAEVFEDKPPEKKPFKIAPKVFEEEGGDQKESKPEPKPEPEVEVKKKDVPTGSVPKTVSTPSDGEVSPTVQSDVKNVVKKEDFMQTLLARRQEKEFDKLAEGIEPDDDVGIRITDEDRATQEEDLADLAASKGRKVKGIGEEAVQKEAEATFSKKTVRRLVKNDALKIVKSPTDLPGKMKVKLMEDKVKNVAVIKGAYDPETGTSYLVADNIAEGEAAGVFLHEVGEHANLEQMVGKKNYDQIGKQLDDLVESGDEIAEAAAARIPKDTKEEYLQSEKIAYLVQEVQDRTAKGETVSSKIKTLYNRVINLIRNYFNKLPAYRQMAGRAALKKLESGQLLTPENITSLARAAVDFQTGGKKTTTKEPPQFSKTEAAPESEPEIGQSKFVDVTEAITAAHGKKPKKKDSIWTKTKEAAATIKDQMTRSHKLLDPKKFGLTTDYLRLMQETGSYAKHKAYTDVYSVVGEMNDKEQMVLSMNLILPDMQKDIESGLLDPKEGLPFNYESVEQVKEDLENFQRQAKEISEDASTDIDINKSIEKRQDFMKELRDELVDEGLLREEVGKDDRYWHHQTLEYLNMEDAGYTSSVEKPGIRQTKKGWQKARIGSTKDYNTKYLDAEFEVLSQARQQLEAKRLLDKIKAANDKGKEARKLQKEFNTFLKSENKKELTLEQTLKESEDFDGYVVWEPNPKGTWYQTYSVADKVAQQILEDGGAEVTEVQKVLAKGAKEQWVIPAELAETLNKPVKNENEAFPTRWARKGIRAWKVWTLLNPFRVLRYNLNNMSGDLDIAVAYAPGILKEFKKAAVDLHKEKKNPSGDTAAELNEARKKGIIDSGFVITEVDDFSKMYEGLFDPKPSNSLEKLTYKGKKIPQAFRELTTYRENIMRLAAWRHFKKKIKDNPDKKIYAASKQTEIDQITDPDQKAAKLARELIGDYGNISHAGQAIRTHLMPFYSWMEINAPRYIRLMQNSKAEGTDIKGQLAKVAAKQATYKGVTLFAKMAAMSTLVSAWNHMRFPEEEEKLSEFEREQLHIILGTWDGEVKTLRFQGAFSDFLSWASLHDAPTDIAKMWKGEKSVTDQIVEMAKAPALKIAAGVSPLFKLPAELVSGESYWPDFMNPRPIRDRFEHIANAFSLGTVYKHLAGKPNKGFGEWSKLLISSTDPGESAYYKNWEKVRKWRDKLGKDDVGGHKPSTRSNALYYYKQAMKYQDVDAAWKYYRKYINLSGGVTKDGKIPKKTLKNINRSIKRANPKSRIPTGTWNAFQKTLTPAEKKTWNEGIKWYNQTYKKR